MADFEGIRIDGLRDLKSGLKELEGKVPKDLSRGFKAIAMRIVDKIKPNFPGKLSGTVKASGTQKGGAVKFMNANVTGPWNGRKNVTGWWDFGGNVGRNKKVHRAFFSDGRFLYPTLRRERKNIVKDVDDLVRNLAQRAGFETRGHL